jgi:uncharacterized protein
MANGRGWRGIWTALALAALTVAAPAQETRVVPLGTGDVTGVYFPVGLSLCRLPNAGRREHGLRCAAMLSGGSVDNIARLRAGDADLAIVQSDIQNAALRGAGVFGAAGPFEELRAVMALHEEPLMLVVHPDAGVARLADLPGRRLGIGASGAGDRALVGALSGRLGWGANTFAERIELAPEAMAAALCEGRIDALLVAMGQPAGPVVEATRGCGARLVAIDGAAVEALAAVNPFYHAMTLPAGTYAGQADDVATIAVGATLVTRADLPDAVVTTIGGAILDDLETLRGLHPVLRELEAEDMARRGLSAELHPAMAALYREAEDGDRAGPDHVPEVAAEDDLLVEHHEERDQVEALGELPGLEGGLGRLRPGDRRARRRPRAPRGASRSSPASTRTPQMGDQERDAELLGERRADQHDQHDVGGGHRQAHAEHEAREDDEEEREDDVAAAEKADHHRRELEARARSARRRRR